MRFHLSGIALGFLSVHLHSHPLYCKMQKDNRPNNDVTAPDYKEPVRIMLADDDKDDQQLFTDAIEETKIEAEVTTVDNGQELIDNLKDPEEPNPDIIFLDINMPVKGGKEVLAEIKSDDNLKDIPTVMFSTSDSPKDVEETFNRGANLYVKKPNSFTGLILLLKNVFTLHWTKALLKPIRKSFLVTEKDIVK